MATTKKVTKPLKGTTQSGFAWEIDPRAADDYELLEMLAELDENPLLLSKVLKKLLGEGQKDNLLDHARDEDGRVSVTRINDEIIDIFNGTKDIKNS